MTTPHLELIKSFEDGFRDISQLGDVFAVRSCVNGQQTGWQLNLDSPKISSRFMQLVCDVMQDIGVPQDASRDELLNCWLEYLRASGAEVTYCSGPREFLADGFSLIREQMDSVAWLSAKRIGHLRYLEAGGKTEPIQSGNHLQNSVDRIQRTDHLVQDSAALCNDSRTQEVEPEAKKSVANTHESLQHLSNDLSSVKTFHAPEESSQDKVLGSDAAHDRRVELIQTQFKGHGRGKKFVSFYGALSPPITASEFTAYRKSDWKHCGADKRLSLDTAADKLLDP